MKKNQKWILIFSCLLLVTACDDLLRNDIPRGRENPEDPQTINPPEGEAEIHITLGDEDYYSGESYTFPLTPQNSSNTIVGTILNISADTSLFLDAVTPLAIEGADAGDFHINQPSVSEIIPGGSLSFSIDFQPTVEGRKEAKITLPNNDPNEYDYTIYLVGEAEASTSLVGEISVRLSDGSELPINSSHYIGEAELNSSLTFQLIIENQHQLNELLFPDTDSIRIIGTDESSFQILNMPSGPMIPQGDFTVNIVYTPTFEGEKQATLEIYSDDEDENPYIIEIHAGTLASGGGGEITIFSMGQEWFETDTLGFSSTYVGTQSYMDIEIANVGSGDLTLGISPPVDISGSSFQLTGLPEPGTVIPASQSITFTVIFSPLTSGDFFATLTIFSNDSDEPSYDLFVSGTALSLQGTLLPDSSLQDGELILTDSYIAPRNPGSTPININGDITITNGATLTIYEGVFMQMGFNTSIFVYGTLQIIGNTGKDVRISGNGWNGIKLQGNANIRHMYIDGLNSYAIRVGETGSPGSSLNLENSRIHHQNNYDAIYIAATELNSSYTFTNNIFIYTTSTSGSQAAVEVLSSVATAISMNFSYNTVVSYGTDGSGITIRENNASNYLLKNNLFYTPNDGYYLTAEISSSNPFIEIRENIYDNLCTNFETGGDSVIDNLPFNLSASVMSQVMPGYMGDDFRYVLDYAYPTSSMTNGIAALEGGLSKVNPIGAYGNGGTPPLP